MATLEEYISRLRKEVQERAEKQNAESTETDIPVEADSNPEPDLTVSDTLEMLSKMGVDTDD